MENRNDHTKTSPSHPLRVSDAIPLLKKSYREWNNHDPFRQAAVIAYYAIFSLPGLIVIIVSLASVAFGKEAVIGQLTSQIQGMMGESVAKQINDMLANAAIGGKSIIATILAVITMILGATGVFVQLQKSMNLIWEAKEKPKEGFLLTVRHRLLSLGVVLSLAFLMIISLLVATLIGLLGDLFSTQSTVLSAMLQALDFVISFGVTALFFALMYKYLPDAEIKWKEVWLGAVIGSALFTIGKFGLGFYFTLAKPATTYGAAGSIILIMLWVFYSCMIFFFGAEVCKVKKDMMQNNQTTSTTFSG